MNVWLDLKYILWHAKAYLGKNLNFNKEYQSEKNGQYFSYNSVNIIFLQSDKVATLYFIEKNDTQCCVSFRCTA